MAEVPTNVQDISTNVTESFPTFESMNLKEELFRGVIGYDFRQPSAIQKLAIIPIASGRDTIAQAQSGTGKTGAFAIGILQGLKGHLAQPQVMVLSHTRELAAQSYKVISSIARYMTDIYVVPAIGGDESRISSSAIREKHADVIVATPGRAIDLMQQTNFGRSLKTIVLDEADKMLEGNFAEDVVKIIQMTNRDIQIVLVSATMSQQTLKVTNDFMRNPARILVKNDELSLEGIRQFFIDCGDEKGKFDTLQQLYKYLNISGCIIFCNSRRGVQSLTDALIQEKFTVSQIHGDLDSNARKEIMQDFRSGATRILVTTDLLARGIDVQHVSLVINYDIPDKNETYLHRIGRSGRFGRKGIAINMIATDGDIERMEEISEFYGVEVSPLPQDLESLL